MNTEKQIEFDKIKEKWKSLAVTDKAREKIDGAACCLSESELRKQMRDTTNSRKLMEALGTPPFQTVEEVKGILSSAQKGECLTPYQLEKLETALAAVKRLKDYLKRGKVYENPLAYYEENLEELQEVREEISRQIKGGQVDDYASRELTQLRRQMAACEEQMKQKAEQMIRTHRDCMADQYYTLRNGRVCLPVKKECRLKIPGSVIDKSATGNTLFMEPAAVAKQWEELELLKIQEENEVYRILYTLSAMAADSASVMEENVKRMEALDFIFSKGKLSMDLKAVEPSINTERRMRLKAASHPLMDREKNVPLQFEIGGQVQGIVITGPNTGGKTVAIKTVMLIAFMAQCGLHVTCEEADVCMNSSYLCDIGDGQNLAENLSTFSAHIKNVLDILKGINQDSFVIMDELGSGTDPTEGMGIAVAILNELKKSKALFLVTTHYTEVKEYADKTFGIVNAKMTFDKETLSPTYQMVIGEAGESCAFYIADRLGMPEEMLKAAVKAAYGEEAVNAYTFHKAKKVIEKRKGDRILKMKESSGKNLCEKFQLGDSVMIFPDKKIGIVCEKVNEKGVLRVQMPDKKIWINHKRVKLHVAASQLYPADYDFSIIFESAKDRKIRHDMKRKYTEEVIFSQE